MDGRRVDGLKKRAVGVHWLAGLATVSIFFACDPIETVAKPADKAICGDGVQDDGETCDDGNRTDGDGCSARCVDESLPGNGNTSGDCALDDPNCVATVLCGNGVQEAGEACDDSNSIAGDGCAPDCTIEPGFVCSPSLGCRLPVCGNRILEGTEACDDGNTDASDGCSTTCTVEAGWECAGHYCFAKLCGDGIVAGNEECEDDDTTPTSGDGCSASCKLEAGFHCPTAGAVCVPAVCGNGVREGLEHCDNMSSDWANGCTPDCKSLPNCTNGVCQPVCGDGVILPNDATEECDDGNTRANDGCSPGCKVEAGFQCTITEEDAPSSIAIPIVYRDFIRFNVAKGHPDFERYSGSTVSDGMVGALYASLVDGKPNYVRNNDKDGGSQQIFDKTSFDAWYRDTTFSKTVRSTLTLTQGSGNVYAFSSGNFYPLDGLGWVASGDEQQIPISSGSSVTHNYNFTSETRYWFQYKRTEVLNFTGDDDVWVFINGRLAVDLGGMHSQLSGSITLRDHEAGLGLTEGGIYEAVVFQAERHSTGSNYRLTLTNFNARKTKCQPTYTCGDGVVTAPYEQCDDGTNTGGYGRCAPGCVLGPRCGDGIIQTGSGENCDDGNTVDGDGCPANCRNTIG